MKINGFGPCHILPNALLELHAEDTPWHLRRRRLHSDLIGDDPIEMGACNCLRTKQFHGVSSVSPHVYSLKSRHGKVSDAHTRFSRKSITWSALPQAVPTVCEYLFFIYFAEN